ncbi:WG repeat-containing protein [Brevibacillus sp. SYSU BS000544]|uniref:WG repeat-containing protein n=1 Tax=Brevibacillus sp. SYSU BS000544 TaxID=3416443 RepID=UPI003CE4F211
MSLYERYPHLSPNPSNQAQGLKYIQIDPPIIYLHAGKSLRLRVKAVYSDGIEKDVTSMVNWGIPTTEVGSISGNGTVHVFGIGSMMVTAEYEGQRAESVIVSVMDDEKTKQGQSRFRKGVAAALALCFLVITGGITLFSGFFGDSAKSESKAQQGSPGMSVILEEEIPVTAEEPAEQATPTSVPATPAQTTPAQTTPAQTTQAPTTQPADVSVPTNSIIAETAINAHPKPDTSAVAKPATTTEAKPVTKSVTKSAAKTTTKPVATLTSQPSSNQPISYTPVEKNGKWGYMKQTGAFDKSLVISHQFDHATRFAEGLALVKKDGKFGYINTEGAVVIPIQYEYATPFQNGVATVKYQSEIRTINKSGQLVK